MIVYKIKNSKIISTLNQAIDYILKPGEYQSDIWYKKPFFNGSAVIESITQIEIDEHLLQLKRQIARGSIIKRKQKGEQIIEDILSWMEEKLLASSGAISQTVYDNTIDAIEDILAPLKNGRLIKVKNSLNGKSLTGGKEQLRLYILGLIDAQL